jgi:hypothetical protein
MIARPSANLAEELTMAEPSIVVLLVLFLLLTTTAVMFWWLTTRESSNRRQILMREWARMARFRILPRGSHPPPAPLEMLPQGPRLIEGLVGDRCTLARFRTMVESVEAAAKPAPPTPPRQWHVLIWPLKSQWPATALRPAHAARGVCDLLDLPPQLGEGTQRFTVCSADRTAARSLGRSSARGLLPPDIGLLLIGRHLLLDFSDRPFDNVEFARMIAVAEQIVGQLPSL